MFLEKLQLSKEDICIWICALSILLPINACAVVIAICMIYQLVKGRLLTCIKEQPGFQFMIPFCLLEIVVSYFYSNMVGVVNAIGMLLVAGYIAYYRKYVNSRIFEYILDSLIFLSILIGIYGLFEFKYLSDLGGYSFFEFHVQNSPSRRIHVFFDNANLYAMMIEFFITSCLYRWVKTDSIKLKVYYVLVGLFNIGMLYLTGCRGGFLPLAIVVPLFFILYGKKKYILISVGLIGVACCLLLVMPDLIPRLSDVSTIESRVKIWKGAIEGIKMYPLFGNGPQTYGHLYATYGWHKAPHAHNIYIDMVSSYGIVGTILLLGYFVYILKEVFQTKGNKALFSLMVCFFVILLVHGLFDCTLNVLATSIFFFMVTNAGCIQKKSR